MKFLRIPASDGSNDVYDINLDQAVMITYKFTFQGGEIVASVHMKMANGIEFNIDDRNVATRLWIALKPAE